MRRLLDDFDAMFDLDSCVHSTPLRDLIRSAILGFGDAPAPSWGTPGPDDATGSIPGPSYGFHYRPHLFPGMDTRLRLAHELQFRLLPQSLPETSPVAISAVLESYCHLSGDLFGWETLRDGRFLLWIVDMSGHGVRAGLASAVLRVMIANLRERGRLDQLVGELNRTLHASIRADHYGLFATAFFLTIDRDGRAEYASAAHPPMLLRRADGTIDELPALDRPIGLFDKTTFHVRTFSMEPRDVLLMFTDGLAEATGHDGEPFGVDRLRRILAESAPEPEEITRAVFDEVRERQDVDRLEDDLTFLAARFPRAPVY